MRYTLDADGYIESVFWGCYSNGCSEYTGTVPNGYTDLNNWSEKAIINAYYIDANGNLILDADRLAELEEQIEQDSIDNTPLLHKDLYGTNDVLTDQYQRASAEGLVIEADNVKKINPSVLFTNINCYKYDELDIFIQGKQLLKNDAITEEIAGITFTKNRDGSIKINGTSTAEIYYNLSGNGTNTTPIFALKNNLDYYLNLSGLSCSMRYYDGETTGVVYEGVDGVINLPENKMVTRVLLTIPTGTTIDNKTIYPMLNYGSEPYEYEEYKIRKMKIYFGAYIDPEALFPSDELYPSEELYPAGTSVDYILIENGGVFVSVNGKKKYLSTGNVNLYDGYNLIYTIQENNVNMTYCLNNLALEGTVTKNKGFRIDEEGTLYCEGAEVNKATINEATLNNVIIKSFTDVGDNAITISSGNTYAKEVINTITDNSIRIWNLNEVSPGVELIPEIELSSAMGHTQLTALGCESPLFDQTSLAETKKNFELLDNGLDIIKETDVYKYNLKTQEDGARKHIGVVIGEGYKTPIEILSESEKAIDLYSMISIAWKSIQEQQKMIETLENKINKLEGEK